MLPRPSYPRGLSDLRSWWTSAVLTQVTNPFSTVPGDPVQEESRTKGRPGPGATRLGVVPRPLRSLARSLFLRQPRNGRRVSHRPVRPSTPRGPFTTRVSGKPLGRNHVRTMYVPSKVCHCHHRAPTTTTCSDLPDNTFLCGRWEDIFLLFGVSVLSVTGQCPHPTQNPSHSRRRSSHTLVDRPDIVYVM